MHVMPKPHPKEFRDDVIAVARKGEAPIGQIRQGLRDQRVLPTTVGAGNDASANSPQ